VAYIHTYFVEWKKYNIA